MKSIRIVFSYDYELAWGPWDKVPIAYNFTNVANANNAAEDILSAHRVCGVPSTWAIVGAMLNSNLSPIELMNSTNRGLKVKQKFEKFVSYVGEDANLFTTPCKIVDLLRDDNLVDFGSHTFSHVYSLESDLSEIRDDFKLFSEIFNARVGRSPVSLVMPKNQVSIDVISIALERGFKTIRVNPSNWLYNQKNRNKFSGFVIRTLRYFDSFIPLGELFGFNKPDYFSGIYLSIGQYFFRPAFRWRVMDSLHFFRLKIAIFLCRYNGTDFHVWSHPHNFGRFPVRSVANLNRLLEYVRKMEIEGKVSLHNMSDLNA